VVCLVYSVEQDHPEKPDKPQTKKTAFLNSHVGVWRSHIARLTKARDMRRKGKNTAKRRSVKLPIRLDAKPTRPHSTKKGKRGYDRRHGKAMLRREVQESGQG